MIWEGSPAVETANKLSEMGIEVVLFQPLGSKIEDGDFLTELKTNL